MARTPRTAAATLSIIVFTAAAHAADGAACSVRSGSQAAALVELYTSEGCSSCPPADRQLGALAQVLAPDAQAVPLALHVDYWDSIGWKDPFAQAVFSDRHDRRVRENHHTVVYTPHFFVDGLELREGGAALRAAVAQANARKAQASLAVLVRPDGGSAITATVDAQADPAPDTAEDPAADPAARLGAGPAVLYLALAQNGLVSDVTRGENRGTRLQHDHVVREWVGPLALDGGTAHVAHRFVLPAGTDRSHFEVVAFVEDSRSGRVLQALRADPCSAAAQAASPVPALPQRPLQGQAPLAGLAATAKLATGPGPDR
jgi:hypothetical protein